MKLDKILRDNSIRIVDGKHVCPFRYPPLSYAIHLVVNVPLFQLVSVCPAFAFKESLVLYEA